MLKKLLIITILVMLMLGCTFENVGMEITSVSKDIFVNYLNYVDGSGEINFTVENTGFAVITEATINFTVTGNGFTLQKSVTAPMFLQHNESRQVAVYLSEVIDTAYRVTTESITVETDWNRSHWLNYQKEFGI